MTEVWVWVTVHGPSDMSIAALDGMPLVMQQESLARRFRPILERSTAITGKAHQLIRLSQAEVVDEITAT